MSIQQRIASHETKRKSVGIIAASAQEDKSVIERQVLDQMDRAKSIADSKPAEALELTQKAYESAQIVGGSLLIDTALYYINRLHCTNQTGERDRLLERHRTTIEKDGTDDQMAFLCNIRAVTHLDRSEFAVALGILLPLVDRLPRLKNVELRLIVKNNLGNCYRALGLNEKAIKWFYEALEESQVLENQQMCAYLYNNLGIVHRVIKDEDPAIEFFNRSVECALQVGDESTIGQAYNNLCTSYYYKQQYNTALEYCQKSYEISLKFDNKFGIQACLTNFGALHKNLEEYDTAIDYYEQALLIASALGNKHQIANLIKNVADIHFAKKEYDQVLPLYDKSRAIAEEIAAQDLLNDLYNGYTNFFEQMEDWERAFRYHKLLSEVQYNLFIGKQREAIEEHRIRFEAEQKEREAQILREQNAALEREIYERKMVEAELKDALSRIKVLTGLLPVCSHCKKIRDKEGEWHQMEQYIATRTNAQFSHGICPECRKNHYDH